MAKAKATKKKATTKAQTKPEPKADSLDVSFAEDIPKISREGAGNRKSKYDNLLDKVKGTAEQDESKSTAVMKFDKAGKATSRYTSIRDAVSKREDADHWTVAVRTFEEGDVRLYVKWNAEPQTDEDDE